MRIIRAVVVAAVAAVVYGMSFSAAIAKEETAKAGTSAKSVMSAPHKIVNATTVIREIAAIKNRKIPSVLLKEASAVIIVPTAAKHDFMVSGGKSAGLMLVHDKSGTWSSPVFITISGGTLGWQIVGEPMDLILIFRNSKNVDAVLKGKLTLDMKTNVIPGRIATTMKGASDSELKADITTYVRTQKALVEDAPVAGTTIQLDAAANDAFYAAPHVQAGEIVSGKVVKSTEETKALQKQLAEYAAAK